MSDIEHPASSGMVGGSPTTNVAFGKEAMQSSIDSASRVKDPAGDARGAVNGEITGGYGFHTGHEQNPWWQVDLGSQHLIGEVVVYNRVDQRGLEQRALPLEIRLSDDGEVFRLVHTRDERFGGKDGAPLRWSPPTPEEARFVRLTTPRLVCLHLDEVEVYGRPLEAAAGPDLPSDMGQTSALASVDEFRTAVPTADEMAPGEAIGTGAPAPEAPPEAATDRRPASLKDPETFLAKFRRALFGN